MRIYKNRYTFCLILTLIILSSVGVFFPINNSSFEPISEWNDGLNLSADELVINTPENKTYIEPMSGYYPATYGFENDEDGSDPDEWTMYEAGGFVNVQDAMGNHTKVVEMYDSVVWNHAGIHKPVPSQTSGAVEYWVMSDNVGKESIFILFEDPSAGGGVIGWLSLDQNKIRYQDNTGWHDTSKIIYDNTWYRIKVEFECTTGNYHGLEQYTWRFYVDGEEFGDFPFQDNIINVSKVYFSTRGEDAGYSCYLDAIGFSWDPNYNIGDNLYEGLLLSFENTTSLDWIGYSLDNHETITILGNTTFSLPEDGLHRIQVFGNNSLGTMYQSNIVQFYVGIVNLIHPENKTYTEPMTGYYPATYGFENDEDGSDPDEWTVYEAGGFVNVQDAMGNHTKVVEMYDSVNWNHAGIHKPVPSQTSGAVEYWVMSDDVGQESIFRLIEDPLAGAYGDGIGWLCLDQNKIRYHDNIGWHDTSKTIYDNTWYRIKVEFECTTGNYHGLEQYTWRFYGDGEVFGDFSFQVNINNVSQVYFSTRGQDLFYSCYLDAIGFSWDSDYNIGDNLKEGLFIGFNPVFTENWSGYSLDDGSIKTVLGNATILLPSDGLHTIQVLINNSLGRIFKSEKRYFTIDTSSPEIIINSPVSDEFFGVLAPNYDITIIELNLDSVWYSLDNGATNISITELTGIISQTEWDQFVNEIVTIKFYANDSFGQEGYAEVVINKDLNPPTSLLSFVLYRGINEVNISTTFILTADDGLGSGVSVIRYKINNSAWADYTGPFTLSAFPTGDYIITYQAIDAVGNMEVENTLPIRLVEITIQEPPPIW